ncbi:MAG: oligogalacturonate lyase family protein [Bryobacteraceae bacterium]|nr:oligogalacturonate lyase family protein [Bryobacteraceae bacterium]MDW8377827.1 oligogalacturonate lyase family protein [Bryobacterales bacterium]
MMRQPILLGFLCSALGWAQPSPPPESWVDPDTGHRVIRLTREPGSASMYFNQNSYLPDGKRMLYTSPAGIHVLTLATRESRLVVPAPARLIEAGRRHPRVYYVKEGAAWYTNVDTGESKRIGVLPPRGGVSTVNADETLLAGVSIDSVQGVDYGQRAQRARPNEEPLNKGQMMEERWAARLPMSLYTIRIDTGERKVLHRANDWLNHLLFSPTDPGLLMFCHEGPWHKVDRIWLIRTDGTGLKKIHSRTMAMEIWGHEFWSPDGKTIWYDLQTPRGEVFWLAGYEVATGKRTWYHLQRNEWSIHFNINRSMTLFAGDGGDPGQVARAPDGQWIYLFRPEELPNRGVDDPTFIRPGVLRAEKLVNMKNHGYRLEPNVSFTPDEKWIVFRSNMFGDSYVFAVEVDKPAAVSSDRQ